MSRKTTVSLNIPPPPTAEIEGHAQPALCSLPVLNSPNDRALQGEARKIQLYNTCEESQPPSGN